MKLQGKWRISLYDGRHPRLYAAATEVQIFDGGPWIGFKSSDGELHMLSFPAILTPEKGSHVAGKGSVVDGET